MTDINKYIFPESGTARQALKLINDLAIPNIAIFILGDQRELLGSLTDGDIRRGLLNGLSIDSKVTLFMNTKSKYFVDGENNFEKAKRFKESGIRIIPVLNTQNRIIKLVDLDEVKTMLPVDAVLMAGGKGERLKPLTDHTPKPMLKVGDKPIIIHNIERLINFGITHFYVSVRHMADQIEEGINKVKPENTSIQFVKEHMPLGTIGSVKLIKEFSNDVVILMNSDLLTNIDFQDFYQKFIESGSDMQVATVPYHVDVPYAVMNINDKEEVISFSEKPRYTYYSNAGIYIFKKELISYISDNCVFDATHFMEVVISNKKKLSSYPIFGYWLDIGRIEDFRKAQEDIKHIKL